jgi:hypothetical protein
MVVTGGSIRGATVNACGTWASREQQKVQEGRYFVFVSEQELYLWMARVEAGFNGKAVPRE